MKLLIGFFQVYLDSPLIVNGVAVRWKGYINLEKLDGVGGFRFDDESARVRTLLLNVYGTHMSLSLLDYGRALL